MPKRPDDWKSWLPVAAAILAAGMWLGRLQMQVTQLENAETYNHGGIYTKD